MANFSIGANAMNPLETQTRPLLHRIREGRIEAVTADPSVTIIEVGDTFGLLLAESARDGEHEESLVLESVLWGRGLPRGGFLARLFSPPAVVTESFSEVALRRHESGAFVAQGIDNPCYLPSPSPDPYIVVFIDKDDYERLRRDILSNDRTHVLDFMEIVLDGVPGFGIDRGTIVGPETYARGVRFNPDLPMRE